MDRVMLIAFVLGFYFVEGLVLPEHRCELILQKDGNIVEDGDTVVGLAGDTNQVYCKALCAGPGPTPALRWFMEGGPRIPTYRRRVYQVLTTFDRVNILTIRSMLATDQGTYTCRGWLRDTGIVSKSLTLQYGCPELQHMCDTSKCIQPELVCDGKKDCDDGTDENNCDKCSDDEFECDSQCYPANIRCDGYYDCTDRLDELNCGCEPDFTCSQSGSCVEQKKVCDTLADCEEGEDEFNCTYCEENMFHCGKLECVPEITKCDGVEDCKNGMDEEKCPFEVKLSETEIEVDEGETAEFICNALPAKNYKFTWTKEGSEISDTADAFDGTLTLSNVQLVDAGRYICEVTDGYQTKSAVGILKVFDRCDGFECSDGTCIDLEAKCDRMPDCATGEDENDCECTEDEFECKSGQCIPDLEQCDSIRQCEDGSDEVDCECAADDSFWCDDTECVDNSAKCNGTSECTNGLDEKDCKTKCANDSFLCDDTECVDMSAKCNGTTECTNGLDEKDCKATCRADEFACNDGTCLPVPWKCNGLKDCNSGEDECGCYPVEFQCYNGVCIDNSNLCDGVPDCQDGEDELSANCSRGSCLEGMSRCPDGSKCILSIQICDGRKDCNDNWDEMQSCVPPATSMPQMSCSEGLFRCPDGSACINSLQVCDGKQDCADNSDEAMYCVF